MSRRLLVFLFERPVVKRDTSLKERIINTELTTILLRSIHKYKSFLHAHPGASVLQHLPDSMLEARQDASEELDRVRHFVMNGSEDLEIKYVKGHETPIRTFEMAYKTYQKEKFGFGRPLTRDEYSTITSCGYEVVTVRKCKVCTKNVTKVNCGDHYSQGNRTKRIVIKNMMICNNETGEVTFDEKARIEKEKFRMTRIEKESKL
jgi:hypothetical protein